MQDLDFMTVALPGPELHAVLADARRATPVVDIKLWGQPAQLVLRYADLREFFADHEQFPAVTSTSSTPSRWWATRSSP